MCKTKSSGDHLVAKIDLIISDANLNKIRKLYSNLYSQLISGQAKDTVRLRDTHAQDTGYQYNFGSLGSLLVAGENNHEYVFFTGHTLHKMLPFYDKAHEYFSKLTLQNITYGVITDNVGIHLDIKQLEHSHLGQSKINYILSCEDSSARTIVYDKHNNLIQQEYSSIPHTAYLLNIDHPHEVRCSGYREILTFKFLNDFSEVLEETKKIGQIRL